ncbi:MAG TPA: hypothetical protein VKK31_31210 [Thermoanaerobaculia bacterium]|nr:hypothetical protein [Thermoanaerobaculia bacterium]
MSHIEASGIAEDLAIVVLSLLLGVIVIIAIRFLGKFPSELDRIGSDLNLYGYGIGLSIVFAYEAGRPVLKCFRPSWIPLIAGAALIFTLILYGYNLHISQKIRDMNRFRFSDGLETWEDLDQLLSGRRGKALFRKSITIGFVPTLIIIAFDIVGGK